MKTRNEIESDVREIMKIDSLNEFGISYEITNYFEKLYGVSLSEWEELKKLLVNGVPDECLEEWHDDFKFCSHRLASGEGNKCKNCLRI